MPSTRMKSALKRLLRRESVPDPAHGEALERELLEKHRAIYGSRASESRGAWRAITGLRPLWAAAAASLVLAMVAEAIPQHYSLPVGTLLTWEIDALSEEMPEVAALLGYLGEVSVADEISVSFQEGPGDRRRLHLILLGPRLSVEEVDHQLRARYPVLGPAVVQQEELSGTARTSLARLIGRGLFSLEVGAADIEEARQEVLEGLAARGLRASSVEIIRRGEGREIRIELEGEE